MSKGGFLMQTGVIYARYSCEKQTENSILGQVRECKEFAARNDIEIIGIYKDEAISGRTATKRPSFMQMIKDGENHKFDNVIVWKGDRFSRSRADAAKYKSILKNKGIRVLSATEANITGPEAILMDGINEAFAEYFSVELAAKVERGMTQNALDGKWNGGKIAFGYTLTPDKKVEINEEEAAVVRKIFNMYITRNITIPEITDELNSQGFRFKFGRKLSKSVVSRILNNEKYYGIYRFREVVNKTLYPPIISENEFNRAQDKLKKLRHRTSNSKCCIQRYYLTGILKCGECGEFFSGHSSAYRNVRYSNYVCNNRRYKKGCDMDLIDKDQIEKLVACAAYDFIMDSTNEDALIERLMQFGKNIDNPEIAAKKKNLEKSRERFQNIQNAIEHGCGYEQFTARLQELASDIKLQEKELEEDEQKYAYVSPDSIREFLRRTREYLVNTDISMEQIINLVVHEVQVFKDKTVIIIFKYANGKTGSSLIRESLSSEGKQEVHQMLKILNVLGMDDYKFHLPMIQRYRSPQK